MYELHKFSIMIIQLNLIDYSTKEERKMVARNNKIILDFPGGSVVTDLPASAGDAGDWSSIPGSGRPPEEGNGNPLQHLWLENSMHRWARQATTHGVAKIRTHLSIWAHTTHETISRANRYFNGRLLSNRQCSGTATTCFTLKK